MARSPWARVDLSRRQVLTGAAVAAGTALVSCGTDTAPDGSAAPDPGASAGATDADAEADVALAEKVIRSEENLLNFGRDCRQAHPELRSFLAPWTKRQTAHVSALREALTESKPPPSSTRVRVPKSSQAAARALLRLLARGERHRRADCLDAQSGDLARLLGSMAAGHAVSVELVRPLT